MSAKLPILSLAASVIVALFPVAAPADWKQEWERTLQAAKKEGQVTVYVYRYEAVFDAFRTEFPEIKLNAIGATGSQLGMRIMAERRGGSISPTFSAAAPTPTSTSSTKARCWSR